jgi:predicted Zn-dependent protease
MSVSATRGPAALAAVLVVAACATSTTRGFETTVAKTLVTPEQENQIGLQLKKDLDQKQKVVYLTDPEVVGYVQGVAGKVLEMGKRDRPEVQWQVFVIDDRKTVNAFATPGGYLYVYRGLLETAGSEAELAGVMAHETGHVVARHAARSLVAAYGLDAVAALASGDNPGLLAQLTTGIATKGLLLQHSRDDETEADEYGARYAAGAGYDPHALATLFGRLQKQEGSTPRLLVYLSDHPATQDRIDHLNSFISSQGLNGTNLGTEPYMRMRTRLERLPSAAPAPSGAPPAPPADAPPPA